MAPSGNAMNTSYRETINWLFSLQKFGIKLGLRSIARLLELLGKVGKLLSRLLPLFLRGLRLTGIAVLPTLL